jgi:hypothetical protein
LRHITPDYLEQRFLALWDSTVAGLQMIREIPEMDGPNCVLVAAFGHQQHFAELCGHRAGIGLRIVCALDDLARVRKPSGLLHISYIADDFDAPDPELDRLYEGEF